MRRYHWFLLLLIVLGYGCGQGSQTQPYQQTSDKPFHLIIEDAEFAIAEYNFRINNQLHIGKAIRERTQRAFPNYSVILLCNITYAEKMLTLDPNFIHHCPYKITIAELEQEHVISTWLLPRYADETLHAISVEINQILKNIVKYAAKEMTLPSSNNE